MNSWKSHWALNTGVDKFGLRVKKVSSHCYRVNKLKKAIYTPVAHISYWALWFPLLDHFLHHLWVVCLLPIIISPMYWFKQGHMSLKISLPDINTDWFTWNSHSPFLALQGDSGYGGFTNTSPIDCTHLELVENVFLQVCHLSQWDRNRDNSYSDQSSAPCALWMWS